MFIISRLFCPLIFGVAVPHASSFIALMFAFFLNALETIVFAAIHLLCARGAASVRYGEDKKGASFTERWIRGGLFSSYAMLYLQSQPRS